MGARSRRQLDCCAGLINLDYSKVDLSGMTKLLGYVDLADFSFVAAVLCIIFNPLFWNLVARWEHKTRSLSKAFGSPYKACYCLGITILLLNFLRSYCFTRAVTSQPKLEGLDCLAAYHTGLVILGVGVVFVLSSFLALGFVGTYLGDYFGILMDAKVTKFPFNVLDNPMYWGSTANYLGWSIMNASPTGLVLTAVVAVTYMVATLFEGFWKLKKLTLRELDSSGNKELKHTQHRYL
ncbi:phosphatidylethanolamine N-methyltransferase isoform X1 [Ornithorhynchus anatinus]|uniref:Phosphatidylethanolamine N-methyltransferase n=2 Tax=Ornithorhynchus anatinus TaxID=9258 RepID=F7G965_ORNAN|nr:phosphatidylethanolamine N-methyltransferase isoform X1 [Ornithorhynchus anatinus]